MDAVDDQSTKDLKHVADPELKKKKKKSKKEKKEKNAPAPVVEEQESSTGEAKKAKKKKSKKSKDKDKRSHDKEDNSDAPQPEAKKAKKAKSKPSGSHNPPTATAAEVTAAWAELDITIDHPGMNKEELLPLKKFSESYFDKDLIAFCDKFDKPTVIQSCSWPITARERDLVGVAETGSGKTLAFGLPVFQRIRSLGKAKSKRPHALVVAPTRELAQQIAEVLETVGSSLPEKMRVMCVYGGSPKTPQAQQLKSGVEILIATPGRLLDLFDDQAVLFQNISVCVLDEADRMLDMGFERDIQKLMANLPEKRQTLMFSATWPKEVQKIADQYITNACKVTLGEAELKANQSVTQHVDVLEPYDKDRELAKLLKKYPASAKKKILVFVLYKKEAARVYGQLSRRFQGVVVMHGDLSQRERNDSLEAFSNGDANILIATDVAGRGLDVKGIAVVINYTFPLTIEDYIHRIGRTGRAGASGISYTFFTKHDKAHAGALAGVIRDTGVEAPSCLMQFSQHTKRKEHPMYGAHFKPGEEMKKPKKIVFD